MRTVSVFIIIVFSLLFSCRGSNEKAIKGLSDKKNDYALNFSISADSISFTTLNVYENWSGKEYVNSLKLIPREKHDGSELKENEILVPPRKVVCMSTSHIAYIVSLGKSETISAVSGAKYVSDSTIIRMVNEGSVIDVGFESSLNYETLIAINPDIVLSYGISGENNVYIDKIKALGIKVIAVGDYMENHPLGKAEYLKFFGALYDCATLADSLYLKIRDEYIDERTKAESFANKKKVLLNAPWKDVWYIPGNESYMSQLIKDAGGEVLGSKSGEFHSYPNSIEDVFRLSYDADLWLNPNNFNTIEELKKSNPLFSRVDILVKGRVFNNTKRNTVTGGSDFWERGVVEPQIILKDLINILHRGDTSAANLKYYKMLN
jgi:iron complex transport system substrate-binding protein